MPDREKVIKAFKERISICSMIGDGRDVTINWKHADDILALLKEQEADIIAMSRFLESHGWDSDSICGKNVEIVVTNGDDGNA